MGKHAYLVMAHTDWTMLNKLLTVLDDPRNDIYIHIDRKANFDPSAIYHPVNAQCSYVKSVDVSWGGDSQIECELVLLKAASAKQHDYYHLLSGQDLPIKSQNTIHDFFDENAGKNFIRIDPRAMEEGYHLERVREYHFFQNLIGRKEGRWIGLLRRLDIMFVALQKKLGIDRVKKCPKTYYKGTSWFSITDEMVRLVLAEEKFIRKWCYRSLCGDEVFLQTVAMNSYLKDKVMDEDLRCIDWERGNPYTFRREDYDILVNNDKLFARKFSDAIDCEVTNIILRLIQM